jgi:hypothetical protein
MINWCRAAQRCKWNQRIKKRLTSSQSQAKIGIGSQIRERKLAAGLFDLGTTLTHLEPGIALANHVDSAPSFDDLAIGVAVFQRANTADNFHRIDLVGRIV